MKKKKVQESKERRKGEDKRAKEDMKATDQKVAVLTCTHNVCFEQKY